MLLGDGVSPKNAAKQIGYSVRAFQSWRIKLALGKQHRQTSIDHIKDELVQFINEEYKQWGNKVKNVLVIQRAEQ